MTLDDFPAEVDLLGRTFRVLAFHEAVLPSTKGLTANERLRAMQRAGAGTLVLRDELGARVLVRVELDGSVSPSSLRPGGGRVTRSAVTR